MKKNISTKRVETLFDTTLLQYCETINLIDDTSVYDTMIDHLVEGDLDKEFISPKLDQVSQEDRSKAFSIARKYIYLCFYEGNSKYWEDSVSGYNPSFPSALIIERLLDNYNFLLELANEKGENVVKELNNFVGSSIDIESSVVDGLRNSIGNDQLLKDILENTSKYKDLSPKEKTILYKYPKGILYLDISDEYNADYKVITEEELIENISGFIDDTNISRMKSIKEVVDYLSIDIFESIIRDLHLYHLNKEEKHNYR